MKQPSSRLAFWGVLAATVLALIPALATPGDTAVAPTAASPGGKMKLSAQLIWGTNDESTDSKLKPIDPKVAKKLEGLPIKWKYYYAVNAEEFSVKEGDTVKIQMSKECELIVKNIDGTNVEVQLVGKGKPAGKVTKGLGKGKCLVTGGDATNYTAWFVFLKQVE